MNFRIQYNQTALVSYRLSGLAPLRGFIGRKPGHFCWWKAGLKAVTSSRQTLTTTTCKEVAMAKRTIPKSSDRNDFQSELSAFSEGRVK